LVVPDQFALEQNYPNPFNPTTRFRFSVPDNGTRSRPLGTDGQVADYGLVTVKVFDILGCEVATFVNENLVPGTYEAEWNASGQASGIYLCQLRAGMFAQTIKLALLR
jgi:hypothetical protein